MSQLLKVKPLGGLVKGVNAQARLSRGDNEQNFTSRKFYLIADLPDNEWDSAINNCFN